MQVIHKPKPKPELMTQTELLAYVHELEAENARLEEGYQKSLGVIAATDCVECKQKEQKITIPTAIEVIKNFCISSDCENCRWEHGDDCMFTDRYPGSWDINYNKYELFGAQGGAE